MKKNVLAVVNVKKHVPSKLFGMTNKKKKHLNVIFAMGIHNASDGVP
jgi:hypothetical protein